MFDGGLELWNDLLFLLSATLRISTPLVLVAFAGLVAERAGIVDIGLEGKILAAAFAAAAVAAVTGSAVMGLGAGIVASILLALLHGFVSINQGGNQIVSGMAINILVAGLAPTLANHFFHLNGQTPLLADEARFRTLTLPFADALSNVPIIGSIYAEVLSGQNVLTYFAVVVILAVIWFLFKTRTGLRLRAVGDNPAAVDTAGISVYRLRYLAMVISGVLCGIAGTVLSTGLGAAFIRDMSAGKGYLALAAVIFGRWKPIPTILACLLFGFVDALQGRLQGIEFPLIGEIPAQFVMMLPYILTVIILAGFAGQLNVPRASGKPYKKEH